MVYNGTGDFYTRTKYNWGIFPQPTVNITVNKSRLKIHDNKNVYLKDGDSFEFEFYNPTTDTICATISINGSLISKAGLLLKPGQRIFLERYLDKNKKFVFSTYEVDGGDKEVINAIAKNGLVEIKFYKEQYIEPNPVITTSLYYNNLNTGSPYTYTTNGSGTVTIDNLALNQNNRTSIPTATNYYSSVNATPTANTTMLSQGSASTVKNTFGDILRGGGTTRSFDSKSFDTEKEKTIETGRVQEGASSKQKFDYVNVTFETLSFFEVSYQILPQSRLEVKDLVAHCHDCGKKVKSKWKFCAACGEPLDE